ncbi:MAG: hypothetical protein FWE61_11150, partial [Micrococcales bacterium]|nr:hypothetical protein [Micrococcales bacterium]
YDADRGRFDLGSHGAGRHWSKNPDKITVIISYRSSTTHVGSYYSKGKRSGEAYRTDYHLTVYDAITGTAISSRTFRGDTPPRTHTQGNFHGRTDLTTGEVHAYINSIFED